MTTYFSAKDLLSPPTERAAFSDRQAYVCAELSKLAYFKFEGGHTLQQALDIAKDILGDDERLVLLEKQLKIVLSGAPSTAAEGEEALRNILAEVGFELVQTYCRQGTQAFFCTRKTTLESGSEKTIAFLVFRGTEPKDFQDIKSDVRARLKDIVVGEETLQLHTGYYEAFDLLREEIDQTLQKIKYDQLFLTGHSLGGALAIVTTRIIASKINGACYTFGAPPVGTIDVQNNLKTPVYEIINEVDIVPRLPNPWMASFFLFLLRLLRLIAKSVTVLQKLLANGTWDEKLDAFMESMTKYRHPGYQSVLVGAGAEARLRIQLGSFDRLRIYFALLMKKSLRQFEKMLEDHSIDVYVEKLKTHAYKRL